MIIYVTDEVIKHFGLMNVPVVKGGNPNTNWYVHELNVGGVESLILANEKVGMPTISIATSNDFDVAIRNLFEIAKMQEGAKESGVTSVKKGFTYSLSKATNSEIVGYLGSLAENIVGQWEEYEQREKFVEPSLVETLADEGRYIELVNFVDKEIKQGKNFDVDEMQLYALACIQCNLKDKALKAIKKIYLENEIEYKPVVFQIASLLLHIEGFDLYSFPWRKKYRFEELGTISIEKINSLIMKYGGEIEYIDLINELVMDSEELEIPIFSKHAVIENIRLNPLYLVNSNDVIGKVPHEYYISQLRKLGGNRKSALPLLPDSTYQLKIELVGAKPQIWRRVLVDSKTTLSKLDKIIQIMFEFEDFHVHYFSVNNEFVDINKETKLKLNKCFGKEKGNFLYHYSQIANFKFKVTLEKIVNKIDEIYPILKKGVGIPPMEDLNSIDEWNMIYAANIDPEFPNREEIINKYGELNEFVTFDEDDKEYINSELMEFGKRKK